VSGLFRATRLCLLVGDGETVWLEGHQCGSLAVHRALGDDDEVAARGWAVSHVATGLGISGEPLATQEQAEQVVKAILADPVLWRVFSATTRNAVEREAPPDIGARLDAAWRTK
jgi:hypothetical protein